jgi:hypothetical protein
LSDDPDRTGVGVDARENLLSVSAYGRQRQSHDKCSSNSRYSRHDVSPVAKLQAFENTLSENPNVTNAAIAAHRNELKEKLLRR